LAKVRPLPGQRYEFAIWKSATVNINYHVEVDRHYSVPYQFDGQRCDVRLTTHAVTPALTGHDPLQLHVTPIALLDHQSARAALLQPRVIWQLRSYDNPAGTQHFRGPAQADAVCAQDSSHTSVSSSSKTSSRCAHSFVSAKLATSRRSGPDPPLQKYGGTCGPPVAGRNSTNL
jgi:hypothetical protein